MTRDELFDQLTRKEKLSQLLTETMKFASALNRELQRANGTFVLNPPSEEKTSVSVSMLAKGVTLAEDLRRMGMTLETITDSNQKRIAIGELNSQTDRILRFLNHTGRIQAVDSCYVVTAEQNPMRDAVTEDLED